MERFTGTMWNVNSSDTARLLAYIPCFTGTMWNVYSIVGISFCL